ASNAVRRAISTASAPVTPNFAVHGKRRRKSRVTAASARSPSACATGAEAIASITRGLRWPSAATPKPAERSMYSRPLSSQTRHPSARAQITAPFALRAVAASDQAAERVGGDVAGELRVLLEAAERVRVPVAS